MKKFFQKLFKSKYAPIVALVATFAIGHFQKAGYLPAALAEKWNAMISEKLVANETGSEEAVVASSFETEQPVMNDLPDYDSLPQADCSMFPATEEVNAEIDSFAVKMGHLQRGYTDLSSDSNEAAACARTSAAKQLRTKPVMAQASGETCRNNHQKQTETLQAIKAQYYEHYVALSKEPACANLLAAAEGMKTMKAPQEVAYETNTIPTAVLVGIGAH